MGNISNNIKPGGKFYFSVPIGRQRIEFNADRVFTISYLIKILECSFEINNFLFVDDRGDLYENVELKEPELTQNYGCNFGCGIFELTKAVKAN